MSTRTKAITAFALALGACAALGPAAQASVAPLSALGGIGDGAGQLREPGGVSVARDAGGAATGSLLVADSGNHRVQVMSRTGSFQLLFGFGVLGSFPPGYEVCTSPASCGHGLASAATGALDSPAGVASTGWGLGGGPGIAVADTGNDRAQRYAADGSSPSAVGGLGLSAPQGIAGDAQGNIYIADTVNSRVIVSPPSGAPTTIGGAGGGPGQFSFPDGIAVDGSSLYVADTANNRIQKLSLPGGTFVRAWGSPGTGGGQFAFPTGVGVGPDHSVYVTDSLNQRVQKFSAAGTFLRTWGFGVATGNDSIFEVCTSGCYKGGTRDESESFKVGQFQNPGGLDVDADGVVYVADTDNYRVQRFAQGPEMSVAPTALEFGNAPLGQSRFLNATVTNTGDSILTVGIPSVTGPDAAAFSGIGDGCAVTPNLSAGQSCELNLTFHPAHTGNSIATLSVPSTTPGVATVNVPMSGGSATAAASYSPGTLDFGVRPAPGPGATRDLTVTSTSVDASLAVTDTQLTGPGAGAFSKSTDCVGPSMPQGQACTVTVSFTPAATGEYSASLEIVSNAPEGSHSVPLTGAVRPPGVKTKPSLAGFSSTVVGQHASGRLITLTSTGGSPVHISGVTAGGADPAQFPFTSDCPGATLARGSTCTVLAGFAPTGAPGVRSASLTVASDSPVATPPITLMGSALAALDPLAPPSNNRRPSAVRVKGRRSTPKARPVFRFATASRAAGFRVKLDKRRARLTGPRFKSPRLKPGCHVLRVSAVGSSGAYGPVAVFRFKRT